MSEELKEYVEDKIKIFTFHAKNFSKEDMDRVDAYCKSKFGNDRKKMILSLITMVENNIGLELLDQKINYLSSEMQKHIEILYNINETESDDEESKKKVSWKGFSNGDNNK